MVHSIGIVPSKKISVAFGENVRAKLLSKAAKKSKGRHYFEKFFQLW